MVKCKKRIGKVMVAIFTTFVVLGSTTAGAITQSTTATTTAASSVLAAAQTSVNATNFILSTSAHDLAVNQKSKSKANTAVLKAIKAVDLLNQNSTDYKSLKATIVHALTRMVNAQKNAKTL